MKNFFTFLLLGLAVAFVSCDDENTENDAKWFQPLQTTVSGTTVEVSCLTRFGDGVLGNLGIGFIYAPSGTGDSVEATNCTIEGSRMSATLSGLSAETDYTVYAFADLSAGRMLSKAAVFRTGTAGEAPDPGPDPEPDEPAFGTPLATEVTTTTATLNCALTFDLLTTNYVVYFRYKTAATTYARVNALPVSGVMTASLSGLTPGTAYEFQLCVDWDGKTFTSASASFTTDEQGVTPPPGGGDTKYAGWAELPVEVNKSGDYYYAYHMRADAKKIRNYSICYSAEMRCAVWTAMPMHQSYDGSAGRNEKWAYDPIIPQSVQPNLKKSYTDVFSRGHMVASNERQVSVSTNQQTFYYTNMAPQYQNEFNGGIWGSLENVSDKMMCSDTLYVVTGAYFANKNKTCKDNNGKTIVVPTHFYKLMIRSKNGNTKKPLWELSSSEIECAGWWLEHKNSYGTKDKISAQYMKSVAEIERLTEIKFFTNIPNAPKESYNASFWGM